MEEVKTSDELEEVKMELNKRFRILFKVKNNIEKEKIKEAIEKSITIYEKQLERLEGKNDEKRSERIKHQIQLYEKAYELFDEEYEKYINEHENNETRTNMDTTQEEKQIKEKRKQLQAVTMRRGVLDKKFSNQRKVSRKITEIKEKISNDILTDIVITGKMDEEKELKLDMLFNNKNGKASRLDDGR